MTHEELLAKITDRLNECTTHDYAPANLAIALRKVVELHKPEQRCYDATCYCKDMCSKCKEDYPCSTIQAIEKALV